MIRFSCPACGAPFEVDDQLAGRGARCKVCQGKMKIPGTPIQRPAAQVRTDHAAGAGSRRLAPLTAGSVVAGLQRSPGRPTSWLEAVSSQVGLMPLNMDEVAALRPKPSPLDEPSIPGPYKLDSAFAIPALRAAGMSGPAGALTQGYRKGLGQFQHAFRWLNESAYLVSVPFLMIVLVGLAIRSHSLVVLGAGITVLLNLGRIVTGLADLVVIPFRDSPVQGVLFLIPPLSLIYLWRNWKKVRKPMRRILGPALTIGLIAAGLYFEPFLCGQRKSADATKGQAATSLSIERLAPKAKEALGSIKESLGVPSGSGAAGRR